MISQRKRKVPYIILSLVFIFIALFIFLFQKSIAKDRAKTFFLSELRHASAFEHIVANGSKVSESQLQNTEDLELLRLAYAKAFARRSPIFGIEGTDPEALRAAVEELASVQKRLVDAQSSAEKQNSASNLYPIRFLESLANLEESRQLFLTASSIDTFRSYANALRKTGSLMEQNALRMSQHLENELSLKNEFRLVTFGGSITDESIRAALDNLSQRVNEVQRSIRDFNRCLSGSIVSCNQGVLDISRSNVRNDNVDLAELVLIKEIQDFMKRSASSITHTYQGPRPTYDTIILESSSCLRSSPPPHAFFLPERHDVPTISASDLFFKEITDKTDGTYFEYMHDRDVSYAFMIQMAYYQCPEIWNDVGLMYAIQEIREFAESHPDLAQSMREALVDQDFTRETDARNYLHALLMEFEEGTVEDTNVRNRIIELHLMYSQRSAKLDHLLAHMARNILQSRLSSNEVELSADINDLFVTHHTFPSLFLTHNTSAGNATLVYPERLGDEYSLLLEDLVPYSELRTFIPLEIIEHGFKEFLIFHQGYEQVGES